MSELPVASVPFNVCLDMASNILSSFGCSSCGSGGGAPAGGTEAGSVGTGAGADGTGAGADGTGAGADGTGVGLDGTGAGADGTVAFVGCKIRDDFYTRFLCKTKRNCIPFLLNTTNTTCKHIL